MSNKRSPETRKPAADARPADQTELRETRLSSELVYRGRMAVVYTDQVRLPDGSSSTREYLRHTGAAAILPLLDNGDVVLIRQFRYPVGRVLWEIPAGKLTRGEEPLSCAQRELKEETGYTAGTWQPLLSYHPCIGYSDEVIHIFLARDLQPGPVELDQGEFLTQHTVSQAEVQELLSTGAVTDSKTLIALQWLLRRYPTVGLQTKLEDL